MGNIQGLTRSNFGTLTYAYNGTNQLQSLGGYLSGVYVYDNNGNTTTDGAKAATINYNVLNLPQSVTAQG